MSKIKVAEIILDGFKKLAAEQPEEAAKVIRALKGESSDAVVKLGSGKNLDALNRASADIAEKARVPQPPAYPKNIVTPDELTNTANRGVPVGGPQTTDFTMVPEGSAPPALRKQTLPTISDNLKMTDDVIETTSSKIDDVAPQMADDVIESTASKVDDVAPQVADDIAPQVADDVAPQVADDIAPQVADDVAKKSPSKLKTALKVGGTVAGATALGNFLMDDAAQQPIQQTSPVKKTSQDSIAQKPSSSNQPSPQTPPESTQQPDQIQGMPRKIDTVSPEIIQKLKEDPRSVLPEEDQKKVIEIGQKVSQSPNSVTEQEIDYLKMLKDAQESEKQSRLINNLLRAGTTIGAAIAGVKPNYNMVDALDKQINDVANAKELINASVGQKKLKNELEKSKLDQQKSEQDIKLNEERLKKAQKDIVEDEKKRDPNSGISQYMRSLMAKAGYNVPETTSVKDLENMGINPQTILMKREAQLNDQKLQEDRNKTSIQIKQMELDRLSKNDEKKEAARVSAENLKETKNKQSFITGAQKVLLKPYQEYQKVNSAFRSIEKFATEKPSGPKDIMMLYDFIKTLDPNSAVKEGEITLTRSGMSMFEQLGLKANRITSGQLLNDDFRRELISIARQKKDAAELNYREIAKPFIVNASSMGMDESDMSKFDYMSQQEKNVKVKRLSDGMTRVMPASQTVNMDKTKYQIVGE